MSHRSGRQGTLLRARVATAAARGLDGRQPEATSAGRASPPNNVAALLRHPAAWSSGVILAQSARGPGFNSRSSPFGSEVCAPPCCTCRRSSAKPCVCECASLSRPNSGRCEFLLVLSAQHGGGVPSVAALQQQPPKRILLENLFP